MPKIICLAGPSGSGKTTIANELVSRGRFVTPRSTTSRRRRKGEPEDAYHFVSKAEFEEMIERDEFVEYTEYAGNYYGLTRAEIREQLQSGKHLVIPIDKYGAEALKNTFPGETIRVFVRRDVWLVIAAIQNRRLDPGDKARRIGSLADEYEDEPNNDFTIYNDEAIPVVASQVEGILGI